MNIFHNALFWIALTTSMVGCGGVDKPSVTAIGTINANGRPLSGAVLTLEPMRNTGGPNVSVPIFNGKFDVSDEAELHGGIYRVRIAMIPSEMLKGLPAEQIASMPPSDAVIAPAFDGESELTCELIAGHINSLHFEIEFL